MTRSKFSTKAVVLATAIGLSTAAFAGSQPAAAQSYTCPAGFVYDPTYGCVTPGEDDFGYYDYPDGLYYGGHHEFGHGFGHGIGGDRSMGFTHVGGGGFGHGMGGGFGHGGGGGHR
jgi:hypothetical protein